VAKFRLAIPESADEGDDVGEMRRSIRFAIGLGLRLATWLFLWLTWSWSLR
jgi:hypothetical protein